MIGMLDSSIFLSTVKYVTILFNFFKLIFLILELIVFHFGIFHNALTGTTRHMNVASSLPIRSTSAIARG